MALLVQQIINEDLFGAPPLQCSQLTRAASILAANDQANAALQAFDVRFALDEVRRCHISQSLTGQARRRVAEEDARLAYRPPATYVPVVTGAASYAPVVTGTSTYVVTQPGLRVGCIGNDDAIAVPARPTVPKPVAAPAPEPYTAP